MSTAPIPPASVPPAVTRLCATSAGRRIANDLHWFLSGAVASGDAHAQQAVTTILQAYFAGSPGATLATLRTALDNLGSAGSDIPTRAGFPLPDPRARARHDGP